MAISVTIADGQVMICVIVPVDFDKPKAAGPFYDKGAAIGFLRDCSADSGPTLAEVGRLDELGVPYFIACAPQRTEGRSAKLRMEKREHRPSVAARRQRPTL